tara:strand:+ start:175 stop:813 length:639 start_codon:yes stop_codon:yes gene_type:complete
MKVVSIIPARGGSKGIPNKNIIDLCGKPLIQYAIEQSIISKVNETWVSSDSNRILKISETLGAKTIKRPAKFSSDRSTSETSLLHFAENVDFDLLVFIQCTVPFIKSKDINEGINKMKKFDSVVAVSETHQMFWSESGPLYDINNRRRRQNSAKRYIETGSFFITTKKNLLKSKNRLSGKIGFVEIPKIRSFEVDSREDLRLAKILLKSNKI